MSDTVSHLSDEFKEEIVSSINNEFQNYDAQIPYTNALARAYVECISRINQPRTLDLRDKVLDERGVIYVQKALEATRIFLNEVTSRNMGVCRAIDLGPEGQVTTQSLSLDSILEGNTRHALNRAFVSWFALFRTLKMNITRYESILAIQEIQQDCIASDPGLGRTYLNNLSAYMYSDTGDLRSLSEYSIHGGGLYDPHSRRAQLERLTNLGIPAPLIGNSVAGRREAASVVITGGRAFLGTRSPNFVPLHGSYMCSPGLNRAMKETAKRGEGIPDQVRIGQEETVLINHCPYALTSMVRDEPVVHRWISRIRTALAQLGWIVRYRRVVVSESGTFLPNGTAFELPTLNEWFTESNSQGRAVGVSPVWRMASVIDDINVGRTIPTATIAQYQEAIPARHPAPLPFQCEDLVPSEEEAERSGCLYSMLQIFVFPPKSTTTEGRVMCRETDDELSDNIPKNPFPVSLNSYLSRTSEGLRYEVGAARRLESARNRHHARDTTATRAGGYANLHPEPYSSYTWRKLWLTMSKNPKQFLSIMKTLQKLHPLHSLYLNYSLLSSEQSRQRQNGD